MKQTKTTRKSVCSMCGKRLSEKTTSGTIRWLPAHVDDTGIYCESCHAPKKSSNGGKSDTT